MINRHRNSHRTISRIEGSPAALVLLFALCLGLLFPQPVAAAEPITPEALEDFFDEVLTRQLNEEGIVGATVAVVEGDALLFAKGYGYADLEAGIPVEADRTLFYIGSDGKLFTWTAVMQLVEAGELDLHADVNTYLDFEIPATYDEPITLHHLMTHTAGFEEELRALLAAGPEDVLPLREFLLRTMPARVYPPGEIFAYSNYGTALAGYIVQRVSGLGYEEYLTEQLLEPLGMEQSAAVQPLPPELADAMSLGYHYRNGEYDGLDFEWVAAAPAAAVRGPGTDIARFMMAHLNGGCVDGACILEAETVAEMHRQQFTAHPALTGMAYGFLESRMNDRRLLWHMGESARFVTVLALLPEEGVGLLVSYNTPPADGREILFRFLDEFYPTERPALEAEAQPGWEERADVLAGTYVPARVSHTSPQKVVGWLGALPVETGAGGALSLGPQRYLETEPWLFHQQDGDRALTFEQTLGRRWLFWVPLTYFKVAWYETLPFHLGLVGLSALLFVSGWIAWPLAAWRNRRRGVPVSKGVRLARWLAALLGLVDLGLLVGFALLLVGYGESYVWPGEAVDLVVRLNWLSLPLTLAVLVLTVRLWLQRASRPAWRVHYSLIALAGVAFFWFLAFWNLLAGV